MALSDIPGVLGEPLTLDAGQHVFRQGDRDRRLYLVEQGLLKAYYLADDGKETIKSFITEGDFIGSLASAYRQETCSFNLVCQERSVLIPMDFDVLVSAGKENLSVAARLMEVLLSLAMKKERREMELLSLSAEDRYRRLLEHSPELIERVKQKDIARYLGITPVALSRIRRRIEKQKRSETNSV